jgi:hypothetical protein
VVSSTADISAGLLMLCSDESYTKRGLVALTTLDPRTGRSALRSCADASSAGAGVGS